MSPSNLITVEGIEVNPYINRGEALLLQKAFASHQDLYSPEISVPPLITAKESNTSLQTEPLVSSLLSIYPFLQSIFKLNPRIVRFFLNNPVLLGLFRSNLQVLELLTANLYFFNLFIFNPSLFFKYISNLGLLKEIFHFDKKIPSDYILRSKPSVSKSIPKLKGKLALDVVSPDVGSFLKSAYHRRLKLPNEGIPLTREQIIFRSIIKPFLETKGNIKEKLIIPEKLKQEIERGNMKENESVISSTISPILQGKANVIAKQVSKISQNEIRQQLAQLDYQALFRNSVFLAYAGAAAITTNKTRIDRDDQKEPVVESREDYNLEQVHEVVEAELETIVK